MPERHTVMDIPRSHFKIQNIIILVTTGVGSIGKDLLMLTFMEPAAVRVSGTGIKQLETHNYLRMGQKEGIRFLSRIGLQIHLCL